MLHIVYNNMMSSIPLTNAEQLWCFFEHLEDAGVDITPYLASNLIPELARSDGQAKITTIQIYNFLEDVINGLKMYHLGWDVGCEHGAAALKGLTFDAFAHGPQEALFELTNAASRHTTNARFFVLRDKHRFELCNIGSMPAKSQAYLQTEYYLAAVYIDFVRRVFGDDNYFPTHVRFRSADLGHEPEGLSAITTSYNQPYFSVDIPFNWYTKPSSRKRPAIEQANLSLTDGLNALIAPHLPQKMLTIEQISTITQMPQRNIQRQLEKEGTNYRRLVLNLRMETAGDLLRQTALSVKEISLRLGYKQTTHFTRAFKCSQGETPREFRRPSI